MFFTQEDYRKIEQWLQRNSVKDTEFQEALPLNGLETITLVQDEHNKKVLIKDLVDQIFKLGVSDFLNVTDKYEASYITLNLAIKLIPSGARKVGQVITFLNTDGNWQVYQFKGALNQWNQLDLWEDLFDWRRFVVDSILPDEEDLTKSLPDENGHSYLSLKDREYNPEGFSGLGRIILRKNIVDIEDPIYGKVKKNILYQDMINKSNTIYEIRYDFNLNGQEITIPEGCILDFQGGSLSNGSVIGNNTAIKAALVKIFGLDINLSGSWDVVEAYPEWFGLSNSDTIDCSEQIQKTVNTFKNIVFQSKSYLVEKPIVIPSNSVIDLNGATIKYKNGVRLVLFSITEKQNVIIKNGYIIGEYLIADQGINEFGVYIVNSKNVIIQNLYLSLMSNDGIYIGYRYDDYIPSEEEVNNDIIITNCTFENIGRNGITLSAGKNVNISNCIFKDINNIEPKAAIDIEPEGPSGVDKNFYLDNIIVSDCSIDNCSNGIQFMESDYSYIRGSVYLNNLSFDNASRITLYGTTGKNSGINIYANNLTFKNGGYGCIFLNNPKNTAVHSFKNVYIDGQHPDFSEDYGNYGAVAINGYNHEVNYIGNIIIDGLYQNPLSAKPYKRLISFTTFVGLEPAKVYNVTIKNVKHTMFENNIIDPIYINVEVIDYNTLNVDESVIARRDNVYADDWYSVALFKSDIFDITFNIFRPFTTNLGENIKLRVIGSNNVFAIKSDGYIGRGTMIDWRLVKVDSKYILQVKNDTSLHIGRFCVNKEQSVSSDNCVILFSELSEAIDNSNIVTTAKLYNALSNTTGSSRPSNVDSGFLFFDTNLNKPIWWTGSKWVDATGAEV